MKHLDINFLDWYRWKLVRNKSNKIFTTMSSIAYNYCGSFRSKVEVKNNHYIEKEKGDL